MKRYRQLLTVYCAAAAWLPAQSFAPEFKTEDRLVIQRLGDLWMRLAQMENPAQGLGSNLPSLLWGDGVRVYKQLGEAARAEALKSALPALKAVAMSEVARKAHDEAIAQRLGAQNHGVAVKQGVDPMKRFQELMATMQKNPMVMQDQKFLKEFEEVQAKMNGDTGPSGSGVALQMVQADLTRYTKPLAELKRDVEGMKSVAEPAQARCYEGALALAAAKPDAFRLRTAKCQFEAYGNPVNEAALDRERKEEAQRVYNRVSLPALLKVSLRDFVTTAATVDFSAATMSKGNRTVFVNPAYEKKSALWKMIFRNGKAPTEVGLAFAKAWLTELN